MQVIKKSMIDFCVIRHNRTYLMFDCEVIINHMVILLKQNLPVAESYMTFLYDNSFPGDIHESLF